MPTGSAETAMHSDGGGGPIAPTPSRLDLKSLSLFRCFFFSLFFFLAKLRAAKFGSPAEMPGSNWSLLQAQAPPPEGPVPRGGDCNTSLMLKGAAVRAVARCPPLWQPEKQTRRVAQIAEATTP